MADPRFAPSGALLLACALAWPAAWAQSAPQSSTAASAAERAQKETDRTMYWIRILATKPAPAPAKVAIATAPRPVAVAAAPAPRPATDTREKVRVAAATTPAAATTSAAPALIPLAQAPDTSQPPVAGGLDPSALSSGMADTAASLPDPAPAPEPDPGLTQIKLVQPDFPGMVVKRVHKGNVEVRFEVDPGGIVTDAVVVESSNQRLNDAAIEAIKQWRFKPTPMSHTAAVNLVFDIDKE
jgi:TonB family protein